MRVTYCDLCGCPIHDKKYTLVVLEDEQIKEFQKFSYERKKKLSDKEICETCNNILFKLFRSRKKGLADLIKSIEKIFKMSPKNPPKSDKKKKNK